jgi:site-specific DNA-adenine methylase
MRSLKAPFPYFGGKRLAAKIVWDALGDVDNFIEPFCGSAAVLLARPHPPRVETINDMDCMVANFWRATGADPHAVAAHADWPVNEADLHARHRWLVLSEEAKAFRTRMRQDPDYYDPKIAGWWCWGACCWIGGGWCQTPESAEWETRPMIANPGGNGAGHGVHGLPEKVPLLRGDANGTSTGAGVNGKAERPWEWQQVPKLHGYASGCVPESSGTHGRPQLADAYSRGRGVHGNDAAGTCEERRAWLLEWFGKLRDRLRNVRVCCGDWIRVCGSDSVTTRLGLTGIFFDPPYSREAGRDMNLYATEDGTVAHDVRAYCLKRGADSQMRIVLAGYAGEGHEQLEGHGWAVVRWATQGGYGNRTKKGKANAKRERLWLSPSCRRERLLFE